ncbi:MAG: PIN domain-containing protein [Bacteroidales bacterium]|jgi:PIN domain nuclease of toxin-antitoxin system|nr:PIN domain-containing protein [Bacteroidales bacterium]
MVKKRKTGRYMLDTNALIGFIQTNKLPKDIREHLENFTGFMAVSVIVLKEIIHLVKVKNRHIGCKDISEVLQIIDAQNIDVLPFTRYDLDVLNDLPVYQNNLDPTDRAIVAHAISMHATLISSDAKFSQYKDLDLWSF